MVVQFVSCTVLPLRHEARPVLSAARNTGAKAVPRSSPVNFPNLIKLREPAFVTMRVIREEVFAIQACEAKRISEAPPPN
jgi:hypothetical protein